MKTFIWFVIIILLALGGWYYYLNYMQEPVSGTQTSGSDNTSAGMRAEENAVVATEQRPGNTVTISTVFLAAPGFVVIHEDEDGAPGAILGSSALLQAGESAEVVVTLSRASKDGERLHAMLHNDTDASGAFSGAADIPVPSRLGGPISGWFEISANAGTQPPVSI